MDPTPKVSQEMKTLSAKRQTWGEICEWEELVEDGKDFEWSVRLRVISFPTL